MAHRVTTELHNYCPALVHKTALLVSALCQTLTVTLPSKVTPYFSRQRHTFCCADVLHFKLEKTGFMSAVPYLAMAVVLQFSGRLADWLRARGVLSTTQVQLYFFRQFIPLFTDQRTKRNTISHKQLCRHMVLTGFGYLVAIIRQKTHGSTTTRNQANSLLSAEVKLIPMVIHTWQRSHPLHKNCKYQKCGCKNNDNILKKNIKLCKNMPGHIYQALPPTHVFIQFYTVLYNLIIVFKSTVLILQFLCNG
jgi:hypothetical protein